MSLARESDTALDFVDVLEWPRGEPPPPVFTQLPPEQAAALSEFRRYLVTSATNRLGLASEVAADRSAATVHVAHGKPYVELLRAAADIGADLIVVGVLGRNPVDLTVFGSTTNQIVRRATCSVLTLRR